MEVEEIQPRKRSRIANGNNNHKQELDEADGKGSTVAVTALRSTWPQHASSRIFRVSRASGGKDRHSKVLTAKGLRDRRVRLSVSTAIQFYDLQDRLGYDQPSKAVEWLIKAASAAIAELPALDSPFPDPTVTPTANAHKGSNNNSNNNNNNQQQHMSVTKSGCSSNSETSKGSVLSLSRSEMRSKARERARERATAKDKDNNKVDQHEDAAAVATTSDLAVSPTLNSQSSFTELLTGGNNNTSNNGPAVTIAQPGSSISKQRQATADYFSQSLGLFAQPQKTTHQHQQHQQHHFNSQPGQFGNASAMTMVPLNLAAAVEHPELQQISFLQDHLIPITAVTPPPPSGDLNFPISSGIAGMSRGPLQSNSALQLPHHHYHHHHHHHQKFASPVESSNLSFFFSPAAPVAAAAVAGATTSTENPFTAGFDARLQLYYTDGYRQSDMKGKGKS